MEPVVDKNVERLVRYERTLDSEDIATLLNNGEKSEFLSEQDELVLDPIGNTREKN